MYSKVLHRDMEFEVVDPQTADHDDGIPEEAYFGQRIWDGEKLVTEKEWALEQREQEGMV